MTIPEQPDDWTEPGAYLVRTGVHRIPLPLPGDSLRAVNAYLVAADDGLVLVDPGWAGEDTTKHLSGALGSLGHKISDISRIVVTHVHWDHYSNAVALRDAHGIPVLLGRGSRASLERYSPEDGLFRPQTAQLRRCGASDIADRVDAIELTEEEKAMPWGSPDSWLDDRERVDLGVRALDVLATPGHTAGHIVLRDAVGELLFAGDHVLPHITPSLALESVPEPKPLRSYLESLRLVQDMPDTLLLPAHGPVTASVHTRVDELLVHHEQRLDAALKEVRDGADTAYAVARALPWTRRLRKLDELDTMSQMLAVIETDAHLDLLADQGMLVTDEAADGVRSYAAAA
ncbi:MBL fold metallo-hydrolase [Streptomyces sp. NPDC004726]